MAEAGKPPIARSSTSTAGASTVAESVFLSGLLAVSLAAFARAHQARGAWVLLALALPGLFVRTRELPRGVVSAGRHAVRALLLATLVFGAGNALYPLIADDTVARVSVLLGYGLGMLAVLFFIFRAAFSVEGHLLPAALGVLTVACFQPTAPLLAHQAVAAVCVVALLSLRGAIVEPAGATPRNHRRRLARLAVWATVAGGLALAIVRLLPWAQPQIEDATARLLNPAHAMAYPGFSEHSRLGDIEQLALSPRVVLRVWTDAPRKLRGRVLVAFDGRTWHALAPRVEPLTPRPDVGDPSLQAWLSAVPGTTFGARDTPDLPGLLRSRIVPVQDMAGPLLLPSRTILVRAAARALGMDRQGIVGAPGEGGPYAALHAPGPVPDEGAAPLAAYLELRADTDVRLRTLAAELQAGAASEEERITRTVSWLGQNCEYSLTPGKFRTRQPVAEFVFEKKRAYCEYFASAAAVLLRLQGVPTRYVSGFAMTDGNFVGGHYVVREADAHAWIEAHVPGRGWVEVDPTPAAQFEALRAEMQDDLVERAWAWITARVAAVGAAMTFGGWTALRDGTGPGAVILAVLASLFVGMRVWKRRGARTRSAVPPHGGDPAVAPEVTALLAKVDAALARCGEPRPAHRAPLEHVRGLPKDRVPPVLIAAATRAVDCFYEARYGGHVPPPDELATLHDELKRAAGR